MTKEEFTIKANKIHNNRYNYSLVEYKNRNTNVLIVCPKHGEFEQAPSAHLNGRGCLKCGNKNFDYSLVDFIEKSKQVHDNKYDYSLVEYKNSYTKIKIICPKHGEFWQMPKSHLSGHGCAKCNLSKGELAISYWLNNNKIDYQSEKTFVSLNNKKSRFDFYIPSLNICIEFDGEQHFKEVKYFKTKNIYYSLEATTNRDTLKDNWCKENNIKLIRIPYNKINQIDQILTKEVLIF